MAFSISDMGCLRRRVNDHLYLRGKPSCPLRALHEEAKGYIEALMMQVEPVCSFGNVRGQAALGTCRIASIGQRDARITGPTKGRLWPATDKPPQHESAR